MNSVLWQSVLGELEVTVSEATFATWFKPTKLVSVSDNEVVISVNNVFVKKQLEIKLNHLVKELLVKNGVTCQNIKYVVESAPTRPRPTNRETTKALQDVASSSGTATTTPPSMASTGLNPRYLLSNFIVGSSNDLAYTASQAVSENPGVKYNPLYLYGGVGLGKTHLMQAIGNEIVSKNANAKVLYITSETFVDEFLKHIRYKTKGFSDKYRNVDVLIVDDMQFIAGKEKTQEAFFHTFNHLHQNNKQIIISSDKPPSSIPTLTERLRSRFEMGMTIDIQLPDFETRCAILSSKAGLSNVDLDPKVAEFLANSVKTNVRELEGVLNKLLATAEMANCLPDLEMAQGLLSNVRQTRPQHLNAKQVVDKTAKFFQIEVDEIKSPRRDKHIVGPRQIAMYLLRSELHLSFPKIANELGRKDHTTAIHSVEKIEKALKFDFIIREQVASIRERLYN